MFAALTVACTPPVVTATPGPGTFATQIAAGVAATLTANAPLPNLLPTAAATLEPRPSPTIAPGVTTGPIPTAAVPVSSFFTDARYVLAEERVIGGHALRVWHNAANTGSQGFDAILTLAQAGEPAIQIEFFDNLDPLTGSDITGDGTPEVIVETYSGGAHCCFSTVVYSLGSQTTKVLETGASNCDGEFRDLDADDVQEYITCDDRFAYAYCPFAASPVVTAILAFDPAQGYVPSSPRFARLFEDAIAAHTALAEQAVPGGLGEWDATTKCAVLPLVLDYLYSGQPDQAWAALENYYQFPDAAAFREEIQASVEASPFYTAPTSPS
jgi:hypothetical protein